MIKAVGVVKPPSNQSLLALNKRKRPETGAFVSGGFEDFGTLG